MMQTTHSMRASNFSLTGLQVLLYEDAERWELASNFPLERRSRWAEPGLKGETERRGGSSPYSSSRLGIWESPHLSLDLGESPHPVS